MSVKKAARILFYDLETSPYIGYTWAKWETNVIKFIKQREILSFAYKFQGDKEVKCVTRADFKDKTDKSLLKKLWDLKDEADVVVAHNGDQFDQKVTNARFVGTGFEGPPSPFQSIDTKKVAKAHFSFASNSLDDLGEFLGLGRKVKHSGFEMWEGVMRNEPAAWKEMIKYNKQDVVLLERVYKKLRPWMKNHPSIALISGDMDVCPKGCGGNRFHKRGLAHTKTQTYQIYQCKKCKGYTRGRLAEQRAKPESV